MEIKKDDFIKILKELNNAGETIMGEWNDDGGCWDLVNEMQEKYNIIDKEIEGG